MADNKDISFKSTQRQKRILPDDSFGDWKWREGLAELMVPIIGSLYRDGINIMIYGKSLVNESPVAIMRAHRFARQSDNNELSELETYPILEYIRTLQLMDCEIDVGEIAVRCPFFKDIKDDNSKIKKYIDALAMLKFNTFHWHLTEDQGWRIEIKKYPKLNTIGSYRDSTLVGHYTDKPVKYDKKKYGGYYSQKEVKDIVAFAKSREVLIIPEIEMPGHAQAAIASYPFLSCEQKQIGVASTWGVFKDIYCTRESTFTFLEDVIDEVMDLFPGKYIHIGGDEAPKNRWKKCNDCQNLIKSEKLKDEHELQSYFITRMEKYINSNGKKIIGWDEILDGGLAPNATVMSWRGESGGIKAAQMGHEVIMSPNANLYFDHYQSKKEGEPIAIGGFTPIEEVYNYNPIPKELDENDKKYIIGAQANVWTEYMNSSDHVEYMVFPRILALSEVLWSSNRTNFIEFKSRAKKYFKRLDKLDVNYSNHLEKEETK